MSKKYATAKHCTTAEECTGCSGYAQNGYIIRDENSARFVCENCYEALANEYPVISAVVEIDKNVLSNVVKEGEKVMFTAGYLLGSKELFNGGFKINVNHLLECDRGTNGTAALFAPGDVIRLMKFKAEHSCQLVGVFRTNPSGMPEFNSLDDKTVKEMGNDIIYAVIAGDKDMQIAIKDKAHGADEIGVVIV